MQLTEMQRRYVQTIFDYFHEQGKWPTYRFVERIISKDIEDFHLREVSKSLPDGFGNGFAYSASRDDTVLLWIDAVRLCKNSEEEISDFMNAVMYCVEKYRLLDEDKPTVTTDELKEHLNLSDLRTLKVMKLLQPEGTLFNGGYGTDVSWTFPLAPGMEGLGRFRGVTTIDEFIEKRNQQRKELYRPSIDILALTNLSQGPERFAAVLPPTQSESQPAKVNTQHTPWASGSFYLVAFLVVIIAMTIIALLLPIYLIVVPIIGGLLFVSVIGALQLRQDEKLSEHNFLQLMALSFKYIPLLRGNPKDNKQIENKA